MKQNAVRAKFSLNGLSTTGQSKTPPTTRHHSQAPKTTPYFGWPCPPASQRLASQSWNKGGIWRSCSTTSRKPGALVPWSRGCGSLARWTLWCKPKACFGVASQLGQLSKSWPSKPWASFLMARGENLFLPSSCWRCPAALACSPPACEPANCQPSNPVPTCHELASDEPARQLAGRLSIPDLGCQG